MWACIKVSFEYCARDANKLYQWKTIKKKHTRFITTFIV